MLAQRFLTDVVKRMSKAHLDLRPTEEQFFPAPHEGENYMLYLHVPFCQVLCPYCSFNRYVYREDLARRYFKNLRAEMLMLAERGWSFESLYFGGGTPTILLDELCETIDVARAHFDLKEVGVETNPNHLVEPWLSGLEGRVQRLSVGVQSFDDGLLAQMDRLKKYGSGEQIFERIGEAAKHFDSLNVDMIFNFPSQTEEILRRDLEKIIDCGARQVTFSPLYVSTATTRKMEEALGRVDYDREFAFYRILDDTLAGGAHPRFGRDTVWTFNRLDETGKRRGELHAEEMQVAYNEYPGIGSGSISHLNGAVYVNTFSLEEYNAHIEAGHMSIMGKCVMGKRDLMRYHFLRKLYQLDFSKAEFRREFGCSVEAGLPMEMAYMRAHGAFANGKGGKGAGAGAHGGSGVGDGSGAGDNDALELTQRGRYLVLVLYRQFLSGMNNLRDQARDALSGPEAQLLFGDETNCAACAA